ncbi:MAG: hypothetical protein ACREBU_18645 [Nitrososphaera sp.]
MQKKPKPDVSVIVQFGVATVTVLTPRLRVHVSDRDADEAYDILSDGREDNVNE